VRLNSYGSYGAIRGAKIDININSPINIAPTAPKGLLLAMLANFEIPQDNLAA